MTGYLIAATLAFAFALVLLIFGPGAWRGVRTSRCILTIADPDLQLEPAPAGARLEFLLFTVTEPPSRDSSTEAAQSPGVGWLALDRQGHTILEAYYPHPDNAAIKALAFLLRESSVVIAHDFDSRWETLTSHYPEYFAPTDKFLADKVFCTKIHGIDAAGLAGADGKWRAPDPVELFSALYRHGHRITIPEPQADVLPLRLLLAISRRLVISTNRHL